jgi:two-component system response regulator HydG
MVPQGPTLGREVVKSCGMTAQQPRPADPGDGSRALRPVILVVDDEPGLRESFRLILDEDYEVIDVPDGPAALDVVRSSQVDLVLLDIRLPGMDGIEVLERIKAIDEGLEVVLVTAVRTVRTAVAAMKLGAFDYLTKPFEEDDLLSLVRRALERRSLEREVVYLRSELAGRHDAEIIGQHPEMQRLYKLVAQVARTTTTVLITGESGTGKELIARAIHHNGPRRDKPFVAVNPAAIADTLMESELFGHEKGAFTGAFQRKLGRFELAQGGTLFLDEIATLKPELQAKLLRVLQEREIERVGGAQAIKLDVRIIAATNADVPAAVARGHFREDLYYRLNVVHLAVPPLRERGEDIPLLVAHFVRRYNREFGKRIEGLTPAALEALRAYRWPGNVRELQNVVERSVVLLDRGQVNVEDLPLELSLGAAGAVPTEALPLNEATDRFERQIVLRTLNRVDGNLSEAARVLGLHRNSLKAKLDRWRIRVRDLGGGAAQ